MPVEHSLWVGAFATPARGEMCSAALASLLLEDLLSELDSEGSVRVIDVGLATGSEDLTRRRSSAGRPTVSEAFFEVCLDVARRARVHGSAAAARYRRICWDHGRAVLGHVRPGSLGPVRDVCEADLQDCRRAVRQGGEVQRLDRVLGCHGGAGRRVRRDITAVHQGLLE